MYSNHCVFFSSEVKNFTIQASQVFKYAKKFVVSLFLSFVCVCVLIIVYSMVWGYNISQFKHPKFLTIPKIYVISLFLSFAYNYFQCAKKSHILIQKVYQYLTRSIPHHGKPFQLENITSNSIYQVLCI